MRCQVGKQGQSPTEDDDRSKGDDRQCQPPGAAALAVGAHWLRLTWRAASGPCYRQRRTCYAPSRSLRSLLKLLNKAHHVRIAILRLHTQRTQDDRLDWRRDL